MTSTPRDERAPNASNFSIIMPSASSLFRTRSTQRPLSRLLTLSALLIAAASSPLTAQTTLLWDADGFGEVTGGTGNWDTSSSRWVHSVNGTRSSWDNGGNDIARFSTHSGTLTLTTGITANSLKFANGPYTINGSSTLTLAGGTGIIEVSSFVTANFNTAIGGTTGLTKTGRGTLNLNSSTTYSGTTAANAGTLNLNFANLSTPTDLISNTSDLAMGGGTLKITGKSTGTTSQTFNGTTINSGISTIELVPGSGTATNLDLGAITRNVGGTVDFTIPAQGTITTSTNASNGSLGGWATINQDDWATVDGSDQIVAATYTDNTWAPGTNTNITTSANVAANSTTNSLRFDNESSDTLTLSGTNTIQNGGILVKTGAGYNHTITGGSLRGAAGEDLVVIQNSTGGLTIDSTITDNASATGLTYSGSTAGTLTLTADNTFTGVTTINQGTLRIGTGGTTGSVVGDIVNHDTLIFNRSNNLTYDGVISGSGDITKRGDGTLTLTADSTLTNTTIFTISDGTLQIGSGGTTGDLGGADSIVNQGALIFNRSNDLTLDLPVSGAGSFTKSGGGRLTLTDANTYTGGTTITDGTLQLGNGNALGSVLGDIVNNGTLEYGGNIDITLSHLVSGLGSLVYSGGGSLTVGRAQPYTGGTTVSSGSLIIDTDGSIIGNILNNDELIYRGKTDHTVDSVISGTGNLSKEGASTLTLNGSNTYTGTTTIDDGTVRISAEDNLGGPTAGALTLQGGSTLNTTASLTIDDANRNIAIGFGGATIDVDDSTILTIANSISGGSNLTKNGTGTLILTEQNSVTADTIINSGTLQLGTGGTTGSIGSGTNAQIRNDGTLITDRSNAITIKSDISGTGALIKRGAGTLILEGDATHSGSTTIEAGAIKISHLADPNSTLNNTSLTVSSGANSLLFADSVIAPVIGSLGGTGNLTLTTDANEAVALNVGGNNASSTYSGSLSGKGSLVKSGTGSFTLSGLNTYAGTTTVGNGSMILDFSGLATPTNILPGTKALSLSGAALTLNGKASGTTSQTVAGLTLDSGASSIDLLPNGGTDTTLALGTITRNFGSTIDFSSTGTVTTTNGTTNDLLGPWATVDGTHWATVNPSDEIVALTSHTNNTWSSGTNTNITATATVSGNSTTNSLRFNNNAIRTLTLSGTNTLESGGILVTSNVGNKATTITGGTLQGPSGGELIVNQHNTANALTIGSVLANNTSASSLTKGGDGTLILTAANTYTGTTTVGGGTLQIGNGGTTGSLAGATDIVNHGAVVFNRSNNVTFAGDISGRGSLTHASDATVILTGTTNLDGDTIVSSGTLQIGNGGSNGAITGNIVNQGSLVINRTSDLNYNGSISGDGSLTLIGNSFLTLNSANTFSGPTTLDGSSFTGLVISHPLALQNSTFNIPASADGTFYFDSSITSATLGGLAGATNLPLSSVGSGSGPVTLTIGNNNNDTTYSGGLGGGGALIKVGTGTLTLSGTNSYTGGTTINGGTLSISDENNLGNPLEGGPDFTLDGGALKSTASFTIDDAYRPIDLGAAGGTFSPNSSTTLTIANSIQGVGSLTKAGEGTLKLTDDNFYTGGTIISAGTLRVGDGNSSGSITGDITNNASLIFARDDNVNFADDISGSGSLTKMGTGTLTLTGNNTATGGITISAGTLSIGDGGSISGDVVNNATLSFDRLFDATFADTISGSGALNHLGAGVLTLTGANTHTGATSATLGDLELGHALALQSSTFGASGSGQLTFGALTAATLGGISGGDTTLANDSAAAVALTIGNNNNNATFADSLSGPGSLTKIGSATQTLSGKNSYTGDTTVAEGTLELDFTALGAPTNIISSSSSLILRGGSLELLGKDSGTSSQTFNGTTIDIGGSTITRTPNSGTATNLSLGALTRNVGGTVDFSAPGSGSITTTTDAASGMLGGWATVGGTDWANVNGSDQIVAASYINDVWAPGNNTSVTTSGVIAADSTTNSLRFGSSGGARTLTLAGTNTLTNGGILVSSGIGNNATLITGGTLQGSAGTDLVVHQHNTANTFTIDSIIADNSSATGLTKTGNGALLLTAPNTYTGPTTIGAGTLQIGAGGTIGSIANDSNIINQASLVFDRSDDLTYAGDISGTGTLNQAGSGTLTLTGDNTFTGGTTVANGPLQIGSGSTTGTIVSDITNNASVIFNRSNQSTYTGVMSGTGTLTKLGSGTLNLTGENTFTGGTTVSSGTLRIGNNTTTGSIAGDIANNAQVTFKRSDDLTHSGVISGTGDLRQAGTDNLTLTGANTYSGLTDINSGGTLTLGHTSALQNSTLEAPASATVSFGSLTNATLGGLTGSGDLALTNLDSAAVALTSGNNNTNTTYTGSLSGAGSLTKSGTGTFTLTDTQTYTGNTSVTGGTLILDTSGLTTPTNLIPASSALTLAGGSLQVSGKSSGTTSQTFNGTTIDAGDAELIRTPNGGTATNLILGDITRNSGGTVNFSSSGTGNTNTTSTNTNGILGGWATIGDNHWASVDGSGNLINASYTNDTWASGNNTQITTSATVPTNAITNSLRFDTLASSVTLTLGGGATSLESGGILVTDQVGNRDITITGQQLSTDSPDLTVFNHNPTGDLTIDAVVATGGIIKNGVGNLILTKDNFNSSVSINEGTLQVGTGGASARIQGNVVNHGSLVFNHSDGISFGGDISGSGDLTKTGSGTLTLNGTNSFTGSTTVNGGTLTVAAESFLGAEPSVFTADQLILNGGTFRNSSNTSLNDANRGITLGASGGTFQTSGNLTIANIITGSGSLTKAIDANTLTLTADNTYTGGTLISTGSLQIGNGGTSGSILGNVTNNSSLAFNRSDDLAFDGNITGSGDLTKSGAGTLTLTGDSDHTGGTTISGGTLQIGNGGTAGSLAGNITNNAALAFNRSDPVSFAGNISGSGSLTQSGSDTLTLTGNNSYIGGTTISSGNLQGDADALTGNILNNATLTIDQNGATDTFAGNISGTGDLVKTGSNAVILSGNNTYEGTTTINSSTVRITSDNNLGSGQLILNGGNLLVEGSTPVTLDPSRGITVSDSASKIFVNPSATVTFAGVVDGTGGLVKDSTGTLILTGANTYAGPTNIRNGTLSIDGDASLGAAPGSATVDHLRINGGDLISTATFAIDSNRGISLSDRGGHIAPNEGTTLTYNGILADDTLQGGGPLVMAGDGTLALGGINTFTGTTTVSSGTLSIAADSALGAAPGSTQTDQINLNGGTLATTASFTLDADRGITLGTGGGTLSPTSGTLTYNGIIAGSNNLTKSGAGSLVLGAANSFSGDTAITAGTLTLGNTHALQNSTVSPSSSGSLSFGSLNATTLGGLTGSGDLTLANSSPAAVALSVGNNNSDTAYSGNLSGAGSLTKIGSGKLTLSGNNAQTGITTISAGTLAVAAESALGANPASFNAAQLTLDGGTLQSTATFAINDANRGLTLGASGGTFSPDTATTLSIDNVITGSGTLTQSGAGTLALNAANTYTGVTTVSSGTLQIADESALGANPAAFNAAQLTLDGGTLNTTATFAIDDANRGLTIGASNGTLAINDATTLTLANATTGSGALTLNDTGTLLLNGDAAHTGGTILSSGGTLQIGNAGTSGSLAGDLTNNGTLIFNRSDSFTHAGDISGSGSLAHSGSASLTLSGTNTYSGGTTLDGYRINISSDSNIGAVPGSVVADSLSFDGGDLRASETLVLNANRGITLGTDGGTLTAASGRTLTYNGIITGSGDLKKGGGGTVILGGVNTFTGGTSVIGIGPLQLGHSLALQNSTLTVPTAGNLEFGTLTAATVGGLTGNNNLSLTNNSAAAVALTTGNNDDDTTYSGILSGSGSLIKIGTGQLTLTGDNIHTGITTISTGTLRLGEAGTSGSLAGNIINNASLIVDRSDDLALNGAISGSGSLTKTGANTLTLNGSNSYSGGTIINDIGSTLVLGHATDTLSDTGSVAVNFGTTLDLGSNSDTVGDVNFSRGNITGTGTLTATAFNLHTSAPNTGVVTANLAGTGTALTITGSGFVDLSGTNTYTGGTTLSGGTLGLGSSGALGTTGTIAFGGNSGGTLQFSANNQTDYSGRFSTANNQTFKIDTNGQDVTFANRLKSTTGGALTKSGAGTLSLSGTNDYNQKTTITGGTLRLLNGSSISHSTKDLIVGSSSGDNATLQIDATASATVYDIDVGNSAGSTGAINASGDLTGRILTVGKSGTGTLNISSGSTVTSAFASVGDNANSMGTVNVSGIWNDGSAGVDGTIGRAGTGVLNILSGGEVNHSNFVILGSLATGNGTATVSGTWDANGLTVGSSGTGELTIAAGGVVDTGVRNVGVGSAGTINIGNGAAAGLFDTPRITGGSVGAVLNFNHTDSNYFLTSDGTASGDVIDLQGTLRINHVGTGTTTLSGPYTRTGDTAVSGGTLRLGHATNTLPDANAVTVSGGTLDLGSNSETIGALTVSSGAITGSGSLTGTSYALTDSGAISTPLVGSAALTKTGAGTTTLSGTNTYSGGTTISAGTLALGHATDTLFNTGVIDITGGTLDLGANTDTVGNVSLSSGSITGSGTLAASKYTFTNAAPASISGSLGGSGALTKTGAGTLTLSGTNTYNGKTIINAGTLSIANGGSVTHISKDINIGNSNGANGTLAIAFGGSLSNQDAILGDSLDGTAEGTANISGTWTNSGTLDIGKRGTGTLTVPTGGIVNSDIAYVAASIGGNGSADITGQWNSNQIFLAQNGTADLTVQAGGIVAADTSKIGVNENGVGTADIYGSWTNTDSLVIGDYGTGTLNVKSGGTVTNQNTFVTISAGGSGTANVSGLLNNTNGLFLAQRGQGTVNILDGGNVKVSNGNGTVTLANNAIGGTTGGTATLSIQGSTTPGTVNAATVHGGDGNATLDFAHTGTDYHFTKNGTSSGATIAITGRTKVAHTGTGTTTLSGANTYTRDTTLTAGTLKISAHNNLGDSDSNLVLAGGTLQTTATFGSDRDVTLNTGGGTLSINEGTTLTLSGDITGDAGNHLTKTGTGTLALGGTNTYSGDTRVDAGTLRINAAGALSPNTHLRVQPGATFDPNGFATSLGRLEGDGNVNLGSGDLSLNQADDTTFAGIIGGTGGLAKSGNGRLTLSGTHTFTGNTSVSGGELRLNGSAANSAFNVTGGRLSGSGTLGSLTVGNGGTIAPGNSPGTLSAGETTWESGAAFEWEVNDAAGIVSTNWDLLNITGGLTITATDANPFTINLVSLTALNAAGQVPNFDANSDNSWTFVTASDGITFEGAASIGASFALNTTGFANTHNGTFGLALANGGDDLNITYTTSAVPEPSSYALLLGLIALGCVINQRRPARRSS